MSAEAGGAFLLFAGGEPNYGDDGREVVQHFPRLRMFSVLPPPPPEKGFAERRAAEPEPWGFPVDVRNCLDIVLDLASRLGKPVKVVDVNRPKEEGDLVRRWVGGTNLLPMLVAPSGAVLEGLASFSPRSVRKFLERG